MAHKDWQHNDPLIAAYLNDLNNCKILSAEEQMELFIPAQKGNKDALKALVVSNLPFVIRIAKNYRNMGVEFPDLINEGALGLFSAVRKYDVKSGNRFSTYAVNWIEMHIRKAIDENSTIHIPRKSKIDRKKFSVLSIYEPFDEDKLVPLVEVIPDEQSSPTYSLAEENEMAVKINVLLENLDEMETKIIRSYFGFDGKKKSFRKIGDELHLSRERIRQIQKKILEKLRLMAEENEMDFFLMVAA